MRASPLWPQFATDAPATRQDILALPAHDFDPARFTGLSMPVLLQIGTESRRENWATDALAAVLPDARIAELPGQGHDAMFTAPELYARQVIDFLRG
jgi:pimeloyl-ACP methyl ester carboxylesterase